MINLNQSELEYIKIVNNDTKEEIVTIFCFGDHWSIKVQKPDTHYLKYKTKDEEDNKDETKRI